MPASTARSVCLPGRARDRAWLGPMLLCVLLACGGNPAAPKAPPVNPVREQIEAQVRALEDNAQLELRYNPAACDCPPFELRLPGGWVRAAWSNADAPQHKELVASLLATAPEKWPIPLRLLGKVDPEVARTARGAYAVRLESSRVLAPAPPSLTPPSATPAPARPEVRPPVSSRQPDIPPVR